MFLREIRKAYGDKIVFDNFCLDIPERKITVIMGASGIGKTTLLNILSDNTEYFGVVEQKASQISYLFQEQRLLPHLTAEKNLEYVLSYRVKDKASRKRLVRDMLEKVGLEGEEKSYPNALSGGMGQRLAMARAFLVPSDLLLMDEPFKGLDLSLKKRMLELFGKLYKENPRTTVFVTHDLDEAMRLADKAVVLGEKGKILFEKDIFPEAETRTDENTAGLRREIYELL